MELKGKKFVFLGDSITQGCGASSPDMAFHQLIMKNYELESAYNAGISGTRIAKQTTPHIWHSMDLYFAIRVEVLPKDADAVVVFGGTNDYGHGDAKIGAIDDDSVYTFYGALNVLYKNLQEHCPMAKIIFMTPLKRTNEEEPSLPENKILLDYVKAIKEFADKNQIPLIDLYESDIFDPYDPEFVPDGLHPNDKGHEVMAEYISKKLLEM